MSLDAVETRAAQALQYGGGAVLCRSLGNNPSATPVLTVAGTYGAGDYVGTSGTAMVFNKCANENGGGGILYGGMLLDLNSQTTAQLELWVFNAAVTPPADNAAWALSAADLASWVATIPLNNSYYACGTVGAVTAGTLVSPRAFKCAAGSKALYGCMVERVAGAVFTSLALTPALSIAED